MDDDLKRSLRDLISRTSSAQVHKALTDIFNEEYAFLHKFFGDTKKVRKSVPAQDTPPVVSEEVVDSAPAPTPASAPTPAPAPVTHRAERVRGDAKVIVMKEPPSPEDLLQTAPQPPVHTESGFRDPKDLKKWQKEQEEKKANELKAAGVNPLSLLTEANLRKWVVDEKKTFSAIAREYIGLSDAIISVEAKKYGLQSETGKRRALIAASKSKKN
jgi:hypothetical protein